MPSHATAQHNSEIRRRQLEGEQITAADHSTLHAIPPIDNPASPAEFPLTAADFAPPVERFAPRSPEQRAAYERASVLRHGGDPDALEVDAVGLEAEAEPEIDPETGLPVETEEVDAAELDEEEDYPEEEEEGTPHGA